MKRLALLLGCGLAAAAFAGPALAADAGPALAADSAPFPAKKVDVMVYGDTITSSRGDVKFDKSCWQRNNFPQKSRVVFRMWAVDVAKGTPVVDSDVKYVYVKIPGQPNLKMGYGKHGRLADSPYFWTAAWAVPADYPLGTVAFKFVVKTKDNKFGYFQQAPDPNAQLTITLTK